MLSPSLSEAAAVAPEDVLAEGTPGRGFLWLAHLWSCPPPHHRLSQAGASELPLKDSGRYLGEPVCCHCLPLSQNCCRGGLRGRERKPKLPWARPPPPGLTLIKQHEEAESPGLHSLKIVALPVVLSQTGLSGLGSWGGGGQGAWVQLGT